LLEPAGRAVVGLVGPIITSTSLKAWLKLLIINVLTFAALL